ncbi:MAG: aminoglycoside phosphotransferase family protein [Pseudomonadales bacterium]
MKEALRRWAESELARLTAAPDAAPAYWQPLPVEASHRRFYRIGWREGVDCNSGPGPSAQSFVVMSSPPEKENNAQFVALAELFAAHGIGVPELHAADQNRGFFFMSDLGETHFADIYHGAGANSVLPAALVTLTRLQRIRDPRIPPYTRQRFADELELYLQWFLGELLDTPAPAALTSTFARLLAATEAQPSCCVHRDFHSRNLLIGADGAVGVVDFQDALMGPVTYDLASLLRDCYHRFSEADVARWRDRYLQLTPLAVNRQTFACDLDMMALQRQLKAVGIFARLHLRDGRDSHLPHIVPVLERIAELAAAYPELTALAKHVAGVLPAARRRLGVAA